MTTNLIDQLITRAAEAEQAKQAAEDRCRQEFIEHAEQAIAATLGELWNTLQPHVVKAVDGDRHLRVLIGGEGLAGMQLAPFWVHYHSNGRIPVYLAWSEHPSGTIYSYPERAGVFFAEVRQEFFKRQKEELKERIKNLSYHVKCRSYSDTPERSDAALAKLLVLAPERADEWHALRAEWQADHDREQAQRAETARQQALMAEYQAAYAGYWQEHQRALAENRVRLKELQKELDGSFTIWRLEYGVIASDEDSQIFVNTAHVNVAAPDSDPDGSYLVFDYGKLARRRYTHVVSVEGPLVCPGGDYDVRGLVRVTVPGQVAHYVGELRYNPAAISREDVLDMANAVRPAYPEEPQLPAGLDEYYANEARRKAINQDEIQF